MSTPVVIDTNIVLDIWVYQDLATPSLLEALEQGTVQWLATPPMREELLRVLGYPHLVQRMVLRGVRAPDVMALFDSHTERVVAAERAPYVCNDADDQKFIDLAVQHTAALHSKDAQVLCMKKRLERCGVTLNPVDEHSLGTVV